MAASEPIDRHYEMIVSQLTLIITHLDELLEQLEAIRSQFEPAPPEPEFRPQFDADSVDID